MNNEHRGACRSAPPLPRLPLGSKITLTILSKTSTTWQNCIIGSISYALPLVLLERSIYVRLKDSEHIQEHFELHLFHGASIHCCINFSFLLFQICFVRVLRSRSPDAAFGGWGCGLVCLTTAFLVIRYAGSHSVIFLTCLIVSREASPDLLQLQC